jgi:outer membrane receptor protein involved in Fe transport
MQRSRSTKLRKTGETQPAARAMHLPVLLKRAPIAAAILAAMPRAHAQQAETAGRLETVIVTAQKRSENVQDVPLSITALGTERLENLRITKFDDYVKYLPSVSFQGSATGGGTAGPGFTRIFMRGVSSGDNGNHSGPLPTVGTYLDEQPITTIQGALDIHIYDIERVEALAGPQGTLYGASSEAGTVRIITNKPDPSAFKAAYDIQGDTVRGRGGYVLEGFANIPVSAAAAVRLVGWSRRVAGYIDNVPGTLTYPTSGVCLSNANPPTAGCNTTPALASKRFNSMDTHGARAALKIDLNESWTITPALMGQRTDADGLFTYDPAIGDLKVVRFYPDSFKDTWWQAALTVEGRISNLDVTYAGAFLKRDDETQSDYTDYSFFYDQQLGYATYFTDDAGNLIDPSMYILGDDGYRKQSHELRVATPRDKPLRFIGGLFFQRQQHDIEQNYRINALPTDKSVTGWPQTLWLTQQERVDRDTAVFGELSYDLLPKLTATFGYRFFHYKNSIDGFFGFGKNNIYGSHTGENATVFATDGTPGPDGSACIAPGINGAPCTNLSNEVSKSSSTPKFNLTYRFDDERMIYATYSRGFRPGGINRRTQPPPLPSLATYAQDFLKNYEIGWKTTWLDNRLRFNGALFWLDWDRFQFSFLGVNSFTIIRNADAARIKGVEADIEWVPVPGLTLTAAATRLDPKMKEDFCINTDENGDPLPLSTCPLQNAVPSGTQLPSIPKFKGNVTARYSFPVRGDYQAHVQGAFVYQSRSTSALAPEWARLLGDQPAYGIADFLAGVERNNISLELFVNNAFDRRAQLYRYSECPTFSPVLTGDTATLGTPLCGLHPHVGVNAPRTFGLRFSQRF